jgi:hypothetical protein
VKGFGTLCAALLALVVLGKGAEAWLARRSVVEESPAELRAQSRLGEAAGQPAKVVPAVSARLPAAAEDPIVYVCGLGTEYHQRTCKALMRTRSPLPLSQARIRHAACSLCDPPRE